MRNSRVARESKRRQIASKCCTRTCRYLRCDESNLAKPQHPGPACESLSDTRLGSAFGAGLQYLLSRNWSVKTEYIHWDLGRANYSMTPLSLLALNTVTTAFTTGAAPAGVNISTAATGRFTGEIVRVSVNYKFD